MAAALAPDIVDRAVALLRDAANPRRILVFGSHARGEARAGSDLDLVVVERDVHDRRAEMVRLMDALRPLRVPVDLLVVTERELRDWSEIPGSVLHAATTEGRTVYEAA